MKRNPLSKPFSEVDLFGRDIAELEAEIERQKIVIKIRQSYSSGREGYGIRTAEMIRNMQVDERQLVALKARLAGE